MSAHRCVHCNEPAAARCTRHRQFLCGDGYCLHLHRWDGAERCNLIAAPASALAVDWIDILVALGAIVTVALGVTMAVVHLGGSR